MKALRIGLTGGIASGKTSAQHFFEQLHVPTIDHDLIARQVIEPGTEGLTALVALLSQDILNTENGLNRQKLKSVIFNNPKLKAEVEAILHPLVFKASNEQLAEHPNEPYVLIVSPLLIESGSFASMDKLIVVDLPLEIQKSRLLARDDMPEELAMSIIQSQVSRDKRREVADYIINNSLDLENLKQQVLQTHHFILKYRQTREQV